MAKKVKLGSTKRYGPRYGRKNREKVAALEKEHRGRHKCPYCNYVKVIRLAKGIWQCLKCDARFAGKAYTYDLPKKSTPVAPKVEEPIEEEETLEELEEKLPEAEDAQEAEENEVAEEPQQANEPAEEEQKTELSDTPEVA